MKKRLRVHPNGRYLMWEDGTPFFYLADTAWELFHKLSYEEAARYLDVRREQGFNAVQAVCLAEFDGVGTPNFYGERALLSYDERQITANEKYFAHVDRVIRLAAERDMFVALLPTWGDKFNKRLGVGPELFTPENAASYGAWLAARYATFWNVIWVLGGDRPLETAAHRAVIDSFGAAIRAADREHLVTFHPPGGSASPEFVAGKDYIDFHMNQSGHDVDRCYCSREMLLADLAAEQKPAMDAESRYEDHPASFREDFGYFWDDADMRQNCYANVLAGACGQTYGNHCVWSFNRAPTKYFPYSWDQVLRHPGAEQMRHLAALRLSRPYFELRADFEILEEEDAYPKTVAARGERYAFVYTPLGLPFTADLAPLGGKHVRAAWFSPVTGETRVEGIYGPARYTFAPGACGRGRDAVLILDVLSEER